MYEDLHPIDQTGATNPPEDAVHPDLAKIKLTQHNRPRSRDEAEWFMYRVTFGHEDVPNIPPGEFRLDKNGIYVDHRLNDEELIDAVAKAREEERRELERAALLEEQERLFMDRPGFGIASQSPLPDDSYHSGDTDELPSSRRGLRLRRPYNPLIYWTPLPREGPSRSDTSEAGDEQPPMPKDVTLSGERLKHPLPRHIREILPEEYEDYLAIPAWRAWLSFSGLDGMAQYSAYIEARNKAASKVKALIISESDEPMFDVAGRKYYEITGSRSVHAHLKGTGTRDTATVSLILEPLSQQEIAEAENFDGGDDIRFGIYSVNARLTANDFQAILQGETEPDTKVVNLNFYRQKNRGG